MSDIRLPTNCLNSNFWARMSNNQAAAIIVYSRMPVKIFFETVIEGLNPLPENLITVAAIYSYLKIKIEGYGVTANSEELATAEEYKAWIQGPIVHLEDLCILARKVAERTAAVPTIYSEDLSGWEDIQDESKRLLVDNSMIPMIEFLELFTTDKWRTSKHRAAISIAAATARGKLGSEGISLTKPLTATDVLHFGGGKEYFNFDMVNDLIAILRERNS